MGSDLSFNISNADNVTSFYSSKNGGNIDFRVNTTVGASSISVTAIHIDASGYVGIGQNNTAPTQALDILGNQTVSGSIAVGTSASVGTTLLVTGATTLSSILNANGQILINSLDSVGNPVIGAVLLPGSDSATEKYHIGSVARKFGDIHATNVYGAFTGSFTGSLMGSVSGTVDRLTSPTIFSLSGDVTSPGIEFTGQSETGTAIFSTTLSAGVVTSKDEATDSLLSDQLLIYRSGTNAGLKRTTKQTFISNIATVPIGAIMPFAGITAPAGYLLCDGSELRIGDFSALFSVIGYTYKQTGFVGQNTFAIPDLRGRFGLGRDNMDNARTVPSIVTPTDLISAGGGSANRVTSTIADHVGQGAGTDEKVLTVSNLPDHTHSLSTPTAQYYAGGLPGVSDSAPAVPGLGLPTTSTGYGLPNSGGITAPTTGLALDIMNPYLTINYIIYTGVL